MLLASHSAHSPPCWAANLPIGEVPGSAPLKPNLERFKYQHPRQRQRPPFQKKPGKDPTKPEDEHKVDDYA